MNKTLLIIDDEPVVREMLGDLLTAEGYQVSGAADGQEGLEFVESLGPGFFDFVLCDVKMPRVDGLQFVKRAGALGCTATIIVMSAYGSLDTAIDAMRLGAYDYVPKPFKTDEILFALGKAEERRRLIQENRTLKTAIQQARTPEELVARSPKMRAVCDLLHKVADYRSTVLFLGETGTGKEALARALHRHSQRHEGPFVAVNCSALPDHLLESDLFGHDAGAFSDITKARRGALEEAGGGTLFLEDIDHLPGFLQVRLLRALQEGVSRRVGSDQDIPFDVRLVAASEKDLRQEVAAGRFREDLFYRLNVVSVQVPPLRERREDIPALVAHFVRRFATETGKPTQTVSPQAMDAILRHAWNGNVRELENVVERAVVMAEGPTLEREHVSPWLREEPPPGGFRLGEEEYSIKKVGARLEAELIRRALRKTRGSRTEASRLLEISQRALLYKIKGYGIEVAEEVLAAEPPPAGERDAS